MKKIASLFTVTMILCLSFSLMAFATDDLELPENDIVVYNNMEYNKTNLSAETLDWLEWYNTLPDDSKEMVSYVPSDLNENVSTFDIEEPEKTFEVSQDPEYPTSLALAPTGGSEPIYNPSYWNDSSRK